MKMPPRLRLNRTVFSNQFKIQLSKGCEENDIISSSASAEPSELNQQSRHASKSSDEDDMVFATSPGPLFVAPRGINRAT